MRKGGREGIFERLVDPRLSGPIGSVDDTGCPKQGNHPTFSSQEIVNSTPFVGMPFEESKREWSVEAVGNLVSSRAVQPFHVPGSH